MMNPEIDPNILLEQVEIECAQRSLLDFGRRMYPGFEDPPHIALMAALLEDVEAGRLRRLMINMPPRHAKSVTCSSLFPAWYLGRNPTQNVIIATHSAELSERNSRLARSFLEDDRFPFDGVKLAGDSTAVNRWNTNRGGGLYAIGTGGGITGRGANILLLDDVTHDEGSEGEREAAYRWYSEVAVPRLEPGGAIIAIGTRFSDSDTFARIIEADRRKVWHVVTLPALAQEDDLLGRELGAPLWPERMSLDELDDRRESMGPRAFAAQFMQDPMPLSGNTIRSEWLTTRYTTVPEGLRITFALDSAAKAGVANDNSALVVLGSSKSQHLVLDVVARKLEYPDLRRLLMSMFDKWRPSKIFVEDTSNAIALIQEMKRSTSLPIVAIKATGSKISRVDAITGLLEAGRILLPHESLRLPWLMDLEREMLAFPNGKHDDMVDALTLAVTEATRRHGVRAMVIDGSETLEDAQFAQRNAERVEQGLKPFERAYRASEYRSSSGIY